MDYLCYAFAFAGTDKPSESSCSLQGKVSVTMARLLQRLIRDQHDSVSSW